MWGCGCGVWAGVGGGLGWGVGFFFFFFLGGGGGGGGGGGVSYTFPRPIIFQHRHYITQPLPWRLISFRIEARSQGISSHGIQLICPVYSGFSTRNIEVVFRITQHRLYLGTVSGSPVVSSQLAYILNSLQ